MGPKMSKVRCGVCYSGNLVSIRSCRSGPGGHSPDSELSGVSDQSGRGSVQGTLPMVFSLYAQVTGGTALSTRPTLMSRCYRRLPCAVGVDHPPGFTV